MTMNGGKAIEGVLCTSRAQPQWETFRHCEEQVSESSHIKQGSWLSFLHFPSVISWEPFLGT